MIEQYALIIAPPCSLFSLESALSVDLEIYKLGENSISKILTEYNASITNDSRVIEAKNWCLCASLIVNMRDLGLDEILPVGGEGILACIFTQV